MKLILASDLKSRVIADFGITVNEIEECFLNRETSFEHSISDDIQSNLIDAKSREFFLRLKNR